MNDNTKVLDEKPSVNLAPGAQSAVGSGRKEAVIGTGLSEIRPSGSEVAHNIDSQLKALGVEEKSDRPDLTRIANVEHVGSSIPIKSPSTDLAQQFMTKEEATETLRNSSPTDSIWGRAAVFLRELKKGWIGG